MFLPACPACAGVWRVGVFLPAGVSEGRESYNPVLALHNRPMNDYTGTPIPPDQAWRTFSDWKSSGHEVGVIFYGGSGNSLYTMGFVESARNGRLLLQGPTVRASFNLIRATFTHGPVQTWPRWPSPPIVEVMAVQARLENGDWLALAEGLRPESLPPRALPE